MYITIAPNNLKIWVILLNILNHINLENRVSLR